MPIVDWVLSHVQTILPSLLAGLAIGLAVGSFISAGERAELLRTLAKHARESGVHYAKVALKTVCGVGLAVLVVFLAWQSLTGSDADHIWVCGALTAAAIVTLVTLYLLNRRVREYVRVFVLDQWGVVVVGLATLGLLLIASWSSGRLMMQPPSDPDDPGILFTLAVALFTTLSLGNTIRILHRQQSQIDNYDNLLLAAERDLRKLQSKGPQAEVVILSPTPAIGNLSGCVQNFRNFRDRLLGIPEETSIKLVMTGDFSSWHEEFLIERVEVIKQRARTDPGAAARALDDCFRESWFEDIGSWWDGREKRKLEREAKGYVEQLLSAARRALRNNSKDARIKEIEPILGRLMGFAWTNADSQVCHMLEALLQRNHAFVLTKSRFPPFIAMIIGDRYYLTWIARQKNGRRNDMGGFVSSDLAAKRIVGDLFQHYGGEDKPAGFGRETVSDFREALVDDRSRAPQDRKWLKSKTLKEVVEEERKLRTPSAAGVFGSGIVEPATPANGGAKDGVAEVVRA